MKGIKKNIELPLKVVLALQKKATEDRRKLKPYMEKVLIEHSGVKEKIA